MASQRWVPIESNPAVLNKYITNLGVGQDCQFVDVYGLDKELLDMVPRPVIAVMLLYPLTEKAKGSEIGDCQSKTPCPASVYFMKQTIANACGTVALVHALANNEEKIVLDAEKNFRKFLEKTKNRTPDERAKDLEEDEGMGGVHDEVAQEGDTKAPSRDESVNPHFIAFVEKEGQLLEMDGRKDAPVNHGKTSPDTLLEDALVVVKKFMDRDPDELNFTLMALVKMQ